MGPQKSRIHILNPLWNSAGGSEWRSIELYRELSDKAEVRLWSPRRPDPYLASHYPIERVSLTGSKFPRDGLLVVIGVYFRLGWWLRRTEFRRIVLVYNTFDSRATFRRRLRQLNQRTGRSVEIVYASEWLKKVTGLPGTVHSTWIDVNCFVPKPRSSDDAHRSEFVIGRLSRDVPEKHHPRDRALYRRLVESGCRVRIMGGTCLRRHLSGIDAIELLPACSVKAAQFLQGLDCFYYRSSDRFVEAAGRVVAEAMACGLPVVCYRFGGYREWIEHGKNGFLFDTNEEAYEIILRLKGDPALRENIGRAARATIETRQSAAVRAKEAAFYLR